MPKRVTLKGKGADLFFGDYAPDQLAASTDTDGAALAASPGKARPNGDAAGLDDAAAEVGTPTDAPTTPKRRRAASPPPPSPSAQTQHPPIASALASNLTASRTDDVDTIRKVVKEPGREVSFVRLTRQEKDELADLVDAYRRQGLKTTETEINRIAINFLLADHRANGEGSVLAKVLAALRA